MKIGLIFLCSDTPHDSAIHREFLVLEKFEIEFFKMAETLIKMPFTFLRVA